MIRILFLLLLFSSNLVAQIKDITVSSSSTHKGKLIQIQSVVDTTDKVFFLIGQSNADGRVLKSEWPYDLQDSIGFNMWWHSGDEYQKAVAGWNTSDNSNLVKGDSLVNGLEIALHRFIPQFGGNWHSLKITRGGAPIDYFLLTQPNLQGRPGYVVQVDSMYSAAPNLNKKDGFFVFIQGETESHLDEVTLDTTYGDEMRRVYSEIREISDSPDLYGITVLTNDSLDAATYIFKDSIRTYQTQVSNEQSNTDYYDPSGLGTRDNLHYNADAYLLIARAISELYYDRIYGKLKIIIQ